ncbi:beta-aspartyl-peptidase [Rhodoferax koreense]|uniref:Isoaspartyl peptidase n=1 Tax=Rhodoferax koreensis TaxID=1842727 RepID=A0A1P8JYC8_9BURK|nr:isoaspartyl peptidase/L-asparaginase [Rhodoferax koreense]APW38757.1 beta-aspartyl-peptidase [Rhodoferax koreense]
MQPTPLIAIHGGAGTILRSAMNTELEQRYNAALQGILEAGAAMLATGAPAIDAVTEAVRLLEECPLFNAGKGAVYTAAGGHELDASVMDGATLAAGAVAGLTRVRNPVLAARVVMRHSGHVLMIGPAAQDFVAQHGIEMVDPSWFDTPERFAQLQRAQQAEGGMVLDHDGATALAKDAAPIDPDRKFGTVGAVALDAQGHLAAATSTGGMTNKRVGRVGDTPVIGAGCYANDRVAVSCTGSGEMFIRAVAAYDVSALMAYAGLSLEQATRRVVDEKLMRIDGRGGLIAVDARGEVSMPFNTEGMYRGYARVGQAPVYAIYGDAESAL